MVAGSFYSWNFLTTMLALWPPNPSELLLKKEMDQFFKEAKKSYDYIIMDTPPLAIVTDAQILARHADHTLFILRQNYTPTVSVRNLDEVYKEEKYKNKGVPPIFGQTSPHFS